MSEVRTVYNPTKPFFIEGKDVILARVESRDKETDTQSMFFIQGAGGVWNPVPGAPVFNLQDPFHAQIGDEHVVGGVETFKNPMAPWAIRRCSIEGSPWRI